MLIKAERHKNGVSNALCRWCFSQAPPLLVTQLRRTLDLFKMIKGQCSFEFATKYDPLNPKKSIISLKLL